MSLNCLSKGMNEHAGHHTRVQFSKTLGFALFNAETSTQLDSVAISQQHNQNGRAHAQARQKQTH